MPLDSSTQIPIVIGNQIYQVWDLGVKMSFARVRSSATRTLVCMWDDMLAIVQGLGGGYANFAKPVMFEAGYGMYLQRIEVAGVPVGGLQQGNLLYQSEVVNGNFPRYQYANLEMVFETPDYDPAENGTLSMNFSSEVMMPSATQPYYKWASDNAMVPPSAQPGIRVGTGVIEIARKMLAAIPLSTVQSLIGSVNSNAYRGFAAGTLLYDGVQTFKRVPMNLTGAVSLNGARPPNWTANMWDVTHRLQWRQSGWNNFLRPLDPTQDMNHQPTDVNKFVGIVGAKSNDPPYPSADFSIIDN